MSSTIQKKTYTIVITLDEVDGGFTGRCNELHAFSQGEWLYNDNKEYEYDDVDFSDWKPLDLN